MRINENFPEVHPVCINLKQRTAKKRWMKKQAKQQKINLEFFTASLHRNPKRGCLESHLTVISEAVKKGYKHLLILEDDALFVRPLKKLKTPPSDWAMLYLGGTVNHVFAREKQEEKLTKGSNVWIRMTCWTTHAYIINLQNKSLVQEILDAEKTSMDMEIDKYYMNVIHPKYPCYMIHPMVCIQRTGYSDIEGKDVDYSFMEKTLFGLRKPPREVTDDGAFRLKMPNVPTELLPGVSIITPTRNREWVFSFTKFNFRRLVYPPEKLEWIIIDSSDTDDLRYQFDKNDKRIKYLHVPECTIAHKRNLGCRLASYPVIAHMDDDDYYPPESLIARVKPIVGYKGVNCVGCSRVGVYDIINDKSYISSDGHISLSEASMAYTKKFWQEQNFDPGCERGEYRSFMMNRLDQIMDLPYIFVICATNHGRNFTPRMEWLSKRDPSKETIRNSETGEEMNFVTTWDEEAQMFVGNLRKYILNSRWMSQRSESKKESEDQRSESKKESEDQRSESKKESEDQRSEDQRSESKKESEDQRLESKKESEDQRLESKKESEDNIAVDLKKNNEDKQQED